MKTESFDKICYINSDLGHFGYAEDPVRVGKMDHFGYFLHSYIRPLVHRDTRWMILLRHRLGGLDPEIFWKTIRACYRGCQVIYAPSFPDIRQAVPWIKKLFPKVKVVTWLWTDIGIKEEIHHFKHCDAIVCLTETARKSLLQNLEKAICSTEILGVDRELFSKNVISEKSYDFGLVGTTRRDHALVLSCLKKHPNLKAVKSPAITEPVVLEYDGKNMESWQDASSAGYINLIRSIKVFWIPLRVGNRQADGYTNVIQALMMGSPAVVSDSCCLPDKIMQLPGVFLYSAGDEEDFYRASLEALKQADQVAFRQEIHEQAAKVFDGSGIARILSSLICDSQKG